MLVPVGRSGPFGCGVTERRIETTLVSAGHATCAGLPGLLARARESARGLNPHLGTAVGPARQGRRPTLSYVAATHLGALNELRSSSGSLLLLGVERD